MILVDTSALLAYYQPRRKRAVRLAIAEAVARDEVAVNMVIQAELVPFAKTEADCQKLLADFRTFHWLEITRSEFELASKMRYRLRREDLKVPTPVLLIAASAISAGVVLYHLEDHYDVVAEICGLEAKRPGS